MSVPQRLANGPGNFPDAVKFMDNYDWLETIARGNFLLNAGVETWNAGTTFTNPANGTTVADSWVLEKGGTTAATADVTRESSLKDTGQYALKVNITAAGSSNSFINVRQGVSTPVRFGGQTIVVGARVRTGSANKVRLSVTDGTTTAYSTFHTGDSTYQRLTASMVVGGSPSALTVKLEISPANFADAVYMDSTFLYVAPAEISADARTMLAFFAPSDQSQAVLSELFNYRRPVLKWVSVTEVDIESGLTGVSGEVEVIFPDGERRVTNSATLTRFNITRNAVLTGTKQSGLRSGLTEANNTWYALYSVKAQDSSDVIAVGSTTLPLQANFATLNTDFGTNGWVYQGMIRNGDQSGVPADILKFSQSGPITYFRNDCDQGSTGIDGMGIKLANASGVGSVAFAYVAGTSGAVIPNNISLYDVIGNANNGSTGFADISTAGGGSRQAYGYSTGNILLNARVAAGDTVTLGGSGTSSFNIYLCGFYDGVLGVGANPHL